MTTMVRSAVVLPPVLVAVTVYVAEEVTAVGVPEMAPVDESRERPAGSDGETDQEVTVPPLVVGVTVVMAVPLVRVNVFGLYVKRRGSHIVDHNGDISARAATAVAEGPQCRSPRTSPAVGVPADGARRGVEGQP